MGTRGLDRRVIMLGALLAVLGVLAVASLRSNRPAVLTIALAQGQTPEAPVFSLQRLGGEGTLDLGGLRGKIVVLNFWASWCVPCRDEAPAIEAAWKRYRDRGVVVVGANVQDLVPQATRFREAVAATYPMGRDRDNRVYRAYGLTGVPETFFIDRKGRVVRKFSGVVTDRSVWFSTIDELLAR
jgi:cytochrome c biogenesis protein CcmG, thiol:disulfide interchange protein DsbE